MCINCLKIKLSCIEDYDKQIKEELNGMSCECVACKSFPSFLLGVNNDLKVLCLTKMKRYNQVCINGIETISLFEGILKEKIKNKLNCCMENIEDIKEELHDVSYLNKMDELKSLYDFVKMIDEADHR